MRRLLQSDLEPRSSDHPRRPALRLKPPLRPDIPRAKREGLAIDLDAVSALDPDTLAPEDHYRLKTYGICAQRHAGVFMLRIRVPGGRLGPDAVAAVVEAAQGYAGGWVHLTTRQNIELHSVELRHVPKIVRILRKGGLSLRSTCGHTVRNVVACPEAGVSADEPFDCGPDAAYLSRALVSMSDRLNSQLPSRVNILLGGCSDCSEEALTNDVGLVSVLRLHDDAPPEPGYQLWAGGSLATAPRLATLLMPFVPRPNLWAAVWSIVHYYVSEGTIEAPAKGRLKFLIEEKGVDHFRAGFFERYERFCRRNSSVLESSGGKSPSTLGCDLPDIGPLPPIQLPPLADLAQLWHTVAERPLPPGVRLQRTPGRCSINVAIPLGDAWGFELLELSRIAAEFGDGHLYLTRRQDLKIRDVALDRLDEVREAVTSRTALRVGESSPVRACPGTTFCSLAITDSQGMARSLIEKDVCYEAAKAGVTIAVSGCPNSCTKHQAADIGLAGGKVRIGGRTLHGYQVFVGADLASGSVGEPIAKVAEEEVVDVVRILCSLYLHERRGWELPGQTFRRLGLEQVGAVLEAALARRRAA